MVAHMNAEALRATVDERRGAFLVAQPRRVVAKGETSGNVMRVREVRIDCDQDAVWLIVDAAGPACHTGERSCFYRRIEGDAAGARSTCPKRVVLAVVCCLLGGLCQAALTIRRHGARRPPTPSSLEAAAIEAGIDLRSGQHRSDRALRARPRPDLHRAQRDRVPRRGLCRLRRRLFLQRVGRGDARGRDAARRADQRAGCSFDAKFDGDRIAFPGALPDACQKACSRRASLAG